MDDASLFGKGDWKVDSTHQNDKFIVIAVNDELSKVIDSFDVETFGTIKKVDNTDIMMIDHELMDRKGINSSEYSCIFSLSQNPDSKNMYLFSSDPANKIVSFQGTRSVTLNARANRETLQARKAILRIQNSSESIPTIHYMREKERREFTKQLNEERSKRIRETKLNESKELEKRLAMRDRQMLRVEDKDKIRNLVIRYLGEREYLSLNELVDLINAPRLYIQDIVKEVAQLQKNGRYVNKYHLRDMYRFDTTPKST